eukprot:scaffold68507_cov63-Phaeocystis_antarctica.AAC.6
MHLGAGRAKLYAAAERRRKVERRQLKLSILDDGRVRGRQQEARAARGDVTKRLQRIVCAQVNGQVLGKDQVVGLRQGRADDVAHVEGGPHRVLGR